MIKINKKLVVYIDDLDRLDKYEILEVIKLIRNTANFYNTFFIVAYDRNYVINALKQHNSYKQEEFLEKIFQTEITLPYYKKEILRNKLAEKLKSKMPSKLHKEIDEEIMDSVSFFPHFLDEWLESMRDVTRLANALSLNLSNLIGEVVFNEFLQMELLRLKYSSAYELLFRKKDEFLETTSLIQNSETNYKLKTLNDSDNIILNIKEHEKNINSFFELFLYREYRQLSIPKNEVKRIVKFVDGIFGGGSDFNYYNRSHLSIIYPSKFNRYFAYTLLEGNLSEIDFSKARTLEQDEFNSKISEWVSKGLEFELKNRFKEIRQFDNCEDYEKIIKAIFHLANQFSQKNKAYQYNKIGYYELDLMYKLNAGENSYIQIYYPEERDKEKFKEVIINILDQAKSPYYFEANFLRTINKQITHSFILSKEELKNYNIKYFYNYCLEAKQLDSFVWDLFYCCKQTEWKNTKGNSVTKFEHFPEEVLETMQNFLLGKDLDSFLLSIIYAEFPDKNRFAIHKSVLTIFKEWPIFEENLSVLKENDYKYLKEFKLFLKAFAAQNYSQHVEFNFKAIPVEEKLNS